VISFLSLLALSVGTAGNDPLMGFSAENAKLQLAIEAKFDRFLDRKDLPGWLKQLSAKPHHVGSPYGLKNAEFVLGLFKSWGFDAQIERFYVLFPSPKERLLEMPGFRAKLVEPPIKEDSTSRAPGGLPPYNAYSPDGDVTGKLVYVNYGMPKDYEVLDSEGISVKGKIVISRYGGGWRGIKPKVASEHGAIGCLIYSDPRDDGFYRGDVYPGGAFRNSNGVQRGSIADMPLFPGDPLTPGVGATKDAKRLAIKDAPTIAKIPTLPISYGDALPLLKTLKGPVAPDDWRGALPITYHIGPGETDVHLKLKFNWDTVEARDVVAKLQGSELPDEWVIRGNHYDGWVMGAEDPLSGSISLLEEAKGIGSLAKTGWKPKRTMIYCLWDGEEPGLLGSTEWVETHAQELSIKAVAYLNTDTIGRGFFNVGGSHSLEKFINQVERGVTDPETQISIADRARAQKLVSASAADRKELRAKADMPIGALGSGSDYSSFLQHLGIASFDMGFGGEDPGGVYHSTYDSYDWYTRFGDPTFVYGIATAQMGGRIMMRLADSDVLPFDFVNLAATIDKYAKELPKQVDTMREETAETNRQILDGTLKATYDPTKAKPLPKIKADVPAVDFGALSKAIARLQAAAKSYEAVAGKAKPSIELDNALIQTERTLLGDGLPRRPWYRHMIYAPGFYTGYGVKTLPAIREALEQRDWAEAKAEIPLVAATLDRLSAAIDRAAAVAGG
jgi:N-acetylated-alpha-linked acidic dipeptidase